MQLNKIISEWLQSGLSKPMNNHRVQEIKRAQKESLLYRTIASLYLELTLDNPDLAGLFVTKVKLSPDKSSCTVFFYSARGSSFFREAFKTLVLYKPSMRKAVADSISSRYAPELVFKYDAQLEKQQEIECLLDTIKQEDSSS